MGEYYSVHGFAGHWVIVGKRGERVNAQFSMKRDAQLMANDMNRAFQLGRMTGAEKEWSQ